MHLACQVRSRDSPNRHMKEGVSECGSEGIVGTGWPGASGPRLRAGGLHRRRVNVHRRRCLTRRGDHDAETAREDADVQGGVGEMCFSVGVDEAGGGAFDRELRGAKARDGGTAGDGFEEEARGERGGVEDVGAGDDREIEESVVHGGARGDEAVVAVLVGVGNGEEKGVRLQRAGVVADDARLGTIGGQRREGGAHVGGESATKKPAEAVGDLGVEAETHGVEKRDAVDGAGVDDTHATFDEGAKGAKIGRGDAEMATEAVAGATRDEAEEGGGIDERGGDLVERAVAADGDHQAAAIVHGATREFDGVSRAFRGHDVGVEIAFADESAGALDDVRVPRVVPGAGVEDEPGLDHAATLAFANGRVNGAWRAGKVCLAKGGTARRNGRMKGTIYVLTGPTAVGKTELALRWAEANDAEIVSCDALLFYRGMDIGTAKPTAEERARVPHHLIDMRNVNAAVDVTEYVAWARTAVADITARGKRVLVAGGSGFYLKSFFAPVADNVAVSPELRAEVEWRLTKDGLAALVAELRAMNPEGLGALDVANPRRVTRALERCRASGKTLAVLAEEFARIPAPFAEWEVRCTRLDREPAELNERIARRIDAMLAAGLVEEVMRLRAEGLERNLSASRAIGYRETLAWIDAGGASVKELAMEIAANTRALVKKQRTWLRTQLPEHRVVAGETATVAGLF